MIDVVVDCSTGQVTQRTLSPAEVADRQQIATQEAATASAGQAKRQAARQKLLAKAAGAPEWQAIIDLLGIDLNATG